MNRLLQYLLFTSLWFSVSPVAADALMISRAMESSAIAQYYVGDEGVRVELELGLDSLESFRNLMPDALYQRMGYEEKPLAERLRIFFNRDLAILVDGKPLAGHVAELGPSRRVLRDPINGEPLPVQDEAPDVIRGVLVYPFTGGRLPRQIGFVGPRGSTIGFVVYHKGVAVNDFRYLGAGYSLTLDWEDPWYSSFDSRQMKRLYSAPMSGFIYVDNFEVRKEIIVRPKDLQRWVDLGLEGRSDIPVEMQPGIRRAVGEFLAQHQPVTIDGEAVEGILDSVNFLERTLTSSRVIDPPVPLQLDSAIMGAIFSYPRKGLPQKVTMDWDLWDDRIQRVPVSAVDQAGPLPSFLEPSWQQLEWTNYLKNPYVPALRVVEAPVASWQIWLRRLMPVLALLTLACALWLWRGHSKPAPAVLAVLLLVATLSAQRYGDDNNPEQGRAEAIVGDLLHNIYRSFDFREEGDIYDVLATSVAGELLTDIFLETSRSLVLANQGGARAKVRDVTLSGVEIQPASGDGGFKVKADWTVNGSVGHWGHIHQRSNRYLAELDVVVDGEQWKLRNMNVLQEERL